MEPSFWGFFYVLVWFGLILLWVFPTPCSITLELQPAENEVYDGNQVTFNYDAEKCICGVTGQNVSTGIMSTLAGYPNIHLP